MSKRWKYLLHFLVAVSILALVVPTAAQAAETIKVGIVLRSPGGLREHGKALL